MEYKIVWVPLAVETYMEEIDFIYLKWNQKLYFLDYANSRVDPHLSIFALGHFRLALI